MPLLGEWIQRDTYQVNGCQDQVFQGQGSFRDVTDKTKDGIQDFVMTHYGTFNNKRRTIHCRNFDSKEVKTYQFPSVRRLLTLFLTSYIRQHH
jgi:hypothetical protein